MQNPQPEWAPNGTPATRGTCPVCGAQIYKRGHTTAHDTLPKPKIESQKRSAAAGSKKAAKASPKKASKTARGAGKTAKPAPVATKAPAANGKRSGKLVIVESPAKAKTIGKYLGRGYRVLSSVGHVRDLLKSRLSVDIESGYVPEYRVPNDKRKVVKELKEAAEKAEEVYLATDPDREGEAIAWHVQEAAEMDPRRTRRVVFQEITRPAVQAAFQHPREIDMERVNAQQARRILDRLVGYKLSPLLWRKVRSGLSAGRVQSVAVRLVVEREREINRFVPEEYWTLDAELSRQTQRQEDPRPFFKARLHQLNGKEPVLSTEADVLPHVAALEKAEWTVQEVRLGRRTRRPAAPFTTSTLQQEASRRVGLGTNKTMRIAQQLYEGVDIGQEGTIGLITYMRTDSVAVAKEAQAEARDHIIRHFGRDYVPAEPPVYKTRSKTAQEAHEAIRPTSVERTPKKMKEYLSREQFRVYQLIWERFVASQMAPAEYDTVSADIMAGPPGSVPARRPYLFRAAGSTLRFAGFLALYEETEPTDRPEESENKVPADLAEGEALDMLRLLPEQHFTQPPPRFSEATLVKELEENGIGRPSTYASTISTIQSRGYVELEEKRLRPTEIGELVTDLLVEYFPDVLSVDFTARLEDELDEIAEGKSWVPVIDGFYKGLSHDLAAADRAIAKVEVKTETEPVGRACPECGSPLLYREGRFGRFIGCSNFPKCRHTEQILTRIGVTCPNCGGDLVEKRTRKGNRLFFGCANYPACEWTSRKRPLPQRCRLCGHLVVQLDRHTAECTHCGERQPITVTIPELEAEKA
ncbi:MAG: type I DNA topoisomerase [Chloroflexi bacterium]|nr:type I DNA topoisomerase [Chloroflexota bacterium]MCI0579235.1 type I DNA topoisomerase [Chloroflexota bacterium]MCI0647092.1 type I DNA topoisomerase [Chloroflexota bacterium]MCI0725866.1 type I DNA topoisomerase [Chloroflexota bacterium]